ncbi:hypothetical protein IMG5_000120 [Ichthyophthirius multifiliis]|uniref:Uncharacterized protein n=1 Tax=Ichthyophthirius multifiliis TaxID=5932 RepID=G0QIP0_ICHMU|nr:hypothetical protein IMG5_000120 [Ichthyophthirius multifiliis]EGR34915.1 hypothetical protein IMG5_000120 [Ichthyophthirius multifiliis]|eukprot:XP_004040219.1 hypothetical protein IMG5_000120 [Ichthyophthirius multifiliis]
MPEIYIIKNKIKNIQNENMKLTTFLNKEQKEIVNLQYSIQELKNINMRSNQKTMQNSKKRTTAPIILSAEAQKAKELITSICQCGEPKPKYKGFCLNCIENMKKEYKQKYENYLVFADKYEQESIKNFYLDTKIIKIKNKIKQLQQKTNGFENEMANEEQDEEKTLLEAINYMKQQMKIVQAEMKMNLNEYNKIINEKYQLQESLEFKVQKKSNKNQYLSEKINQYLITPLQVIL